jgi:D-glycero-D-manno-heptose 1,7-bisphosphate phosphatase
MVPLADINNDWTLFIDRDGVINHEKENDYIHTWGEFRFYDGALEAFEIFAGIFKYIIIITNQKGVSKGVTKEEDLKMIHKNMQTEIEKQHGRIDAIYYCIDMDNDSPNRKPQPGMGLQAVKDFTDIDLTKAIMIGNTLSDMHFGRNLGVKTVFLPTTRPEVDLNDESIDAVYPSLIAFALSLA